MNKPNTQVASCETTPGPYTLEFIGDNAAEIQPMNYLLRFGGGNSSRLEYEPIDVANAQFILEAMNCHKDLLEACKLFVLAAEHWNKWNGRLSEETHNKAMVLAESAIAKATQKAGAK